VRLQLFPPSVVLERAAKTEQPSVWERELPPSLGAGSEASAMGHDHSIGRRRRGTACKREAATTTTTLNIYFT
jgi:hypothetical protein